MWEREITHTPGTAAYWEAQSAFSDAVVQPAAGTLSASKCTLTWNRTTPAGTREDLATINLHMCIHVGAASYVRLTDTQKADAETPIKAFIDAWALNGVNQWTHQEIVWHDVTAGDTFYGPADRRTTYTKVGGNAGNRMPDQNAVTVTLRTASRKHWGRFYLGGLPTNGYDTVYGRPANAICDAYASATRTLALALNSLTAHTELVVYSHAHQAVMTVDEIRCDNVPDIIRRRRAKQSSYAKSFTG